MGRKPLTEENMPFFHLKGHQGAIPLYRDVKKRVDEFMTLIRSLEEKLESPLRDADELKWASGAFSYMEERLADTSLSIHVLGSVLRDFEKEVPPFSDWVREHLYTKPEVSKEQTR